MAKFGLILFLVVTSYGAVLAQSKPGQWVPDLTADKYAQLAIRSQQRSQPDSAATYWRLAANQYTVPRQLLRRAYCQGQRAIALADGLHFDQAQSIADSLLTSLAANDPTADLIRADAHQALGLICRGKSQFQRALDQQQQALTIRRAVLGNTHALLADSFVHIGTAYYYLDRDSLALAYYQQALALRRTAFGDSSYAAAATCVYLCNTHYFLGNYGESATYGEQALSGLRRSIGTNNATYASCLTALGNLYGAQGDVEKAISLHRQALDVYQQTCGEQHRLTARAYQNVCWAYDMHGEYKRAMDYGLQALKRLQALYGDDNAQLLAIHHILGGTYAKTNQYEQAKVHYQRNLELNRRYNSENPAALMLPYQNLGRVSYNLNQYDSANAYYHRSLALQRQFRGEKHAYTVSLYSDMATNHAEAGQLDSTLFYHQKALHAAQLMHGNKHPDIARSYYGMAQLLTRRKEWVTALTYVQKTLEANLPYYTAGDITQNPTGMASVQPFSRSQLWNALQLKGNLLFRRYQTDHNTAWLTASWATYQVLDSLMTRYWQVGDNAAERPALARTAAEIYGEALPVCLALSPEQGGGPAQAFRLAQQSKSMLLTATLNETAARQAVALPDSLRKREEQLRTAINRYEQQLAEQRLASPAADTGQSATQSALFLANRQLEELTLRLERDYPRFRQQKYQTHPVTVGLLQQRLPARTALIDYMLTDSLLVIFTITRTRFDTRTMPVDAAFRRRLTAFRSSIQEREATVYNPVAYQLYQQLLPVSLPDSIESLLIVPAGELALIPFDALLTKPTPTTVPDTDRPYLLRRYAVSYAYSSTVWWQTSAPEVKIPTAAVPRLLAIAPVFIDEQRLTARNGSGDDYGFSPLPATEREVQAIGQLVTQVGGQATVLTRNMATETAVKKADLASYQYIHIATHGLLNDRPELSGLVMAAEKNAPDDGILYSGELYALPLQADLVVLSACDTGLGTLVPGEGVVGLGRALFYASARSLSVSLWPVPDDATASLMTRFYQQLLAHKPQAVALRSAKMTLLSNPRQAAPYYWASFVLITGGGIPAFGLAD